MAFSFTPGQVAAPGTPNQGFTPAPAPGVTPQPQSNIPSVPDSPFLFMRNRDQPMSVNAYLQIILMFVAVLSVIFSLLLFLYSQYLNSSIASKKVELLEADKKFKEYPIDNMKRLSKRFSSIDKLLKEYVSIRSPLSILESVVEKQVVFNNFILSKDNRNSGHVMTFSVVTGDYYTLIQQLKALGLDEYTKFIPEKKVNGFSETPNAGTKSIVVQVVTPVFVQGRLPDEIIFLPQASSSSVDTSSTSRTP